MDKLSEKDILHIAELAKLTLTKEEIKKYQGQLSKIVEYVGELNEVDTSNTNPTAQTTGLTDVTRNDAVETGQSLTVEEALSGTDSAVNNYFVSPGVLTERGEK